MIFRPAFYSHPQLYTYLYICYFTCGRWQLVFLSNKTIDCILKWKWHCFSFYNPRYVCSFTYIYLSFSNLTKTHACWIYIVVSIWLRYGLTLSQFTSPTDIHFPWSTITVVERRGQTYSLGTNLEPQSVATIWTLSEWMDHANRNDGVMPCRTYPLYVPVPSSLSLNLFGLPRLEIRPSER